MVLLDHVGEAVRAVAKGGRRGGITSLDDLALLVQAEVNRRRARLRVGRFVGQSNRDRLLDGAALVVHIAGFTHLGAMGKRRDGLVLGFTQKRCKIGNVGLLSNRRR